MQGADARPGRPSRSNTPRARKPRQTRQRAEPDARWQSLIKAGRCLAKS